MTKGPGHPSDPGAGGPEGDSFWWLNDEAARASKPSDTRMRLERLRADVHSAPDLSAKILGRAGAQDVFVPAERRRAIRAMRWGGSLAAAMALGVCLWVVHRTPAGETLVAQGPTPVTDLVDDITQDAQRFASNVRTLPGRVVVNAQWTPDDARPIDTDAPRLQPRSFTVASTMPAGFSPASPEAFAAQGAPLRRETVSYTHRVAPLGASHLASAFDRIARALDAAALGPVTSDPAVRAASPAMMDARQTGFFASDPDGR